MKFRSKGLKERQRFYILHRIRRLLPACIHTLQLSIAALSTVGRCRRANEERGEQSETRDLYYKGVKVDCGNSIWCTHTAAQFSSHLDDDDGARTFIVCVPQFCNPSIGNSEFSVNGKESEVSEKQQRQAEKKEERFVAVRTIRTAPRVDKEQRNSLLGKNRLRRKRRKNFFFSSHFSIHIQSLDFQLNRSIVRRYQTFFSVEVKASQSQKFLVFNPSNLWTIRCESWGKSGAKWLSSGKC